MRRWMFSNTTMASSTTRPMESTSASSVIRFTVKPNAAKAMKAETRQTGMVTAGMAIVRSDPRNARMTRLTRTMVTAMVRYTELMASRMNTESSEPVESSMWAGREAFKRSISAFTCSSVSNVLAVDCLMMPMLTVGRPLAR